MSWARVQGCPTPSLRAGRTGSACGSLHSGAAAADSGGRHLLQRGGSAAAHAASAHRRYLTWLHGEIMLVVFVGLVPFGVFMAYARKSMMSRWWFQVHRAVQVGAWLVNLASVIIVGSQINMASVKRSRVVLVHVAVGIALEIIVGVQALIALLVRPSHESPLRQSWNVTHRWLGWLVALVALTQLAGGMLLGHRPMRDYWAVFGVLVGWFLAFYLLDLVRYSRLPPPGQPQAGPAKGGWAGTGDAELLPRGQRPPEAAADVPNVGGYRDGPEGGGLVAAAIGGGRRAAARGPSSAEV